MKELKAEIKSRVPQTLVSDYSIGYNAGLQEALKLIERSEQNYVFPRVTRKMKLSTIVERLKKELKEDTVHYNKDFKAIGYAYYDDDSIDRWFRTICDIINNKISFVSVNASDEQKWLYDMAGITEIEVDV